MYGGKRGVQGHLVTWYKVKRVVRLRVVHFLFMLLN